MAENHRTPDDIVVRLRRAVDKALERSPALLEEAADLIERERKAHYNYQTWAGERSRSSNTKLRARAVVGETELHDWEARCLMERTPACKRVYLADEADREIERLTRERDTWRGHYQDTSAVETSGELEQLRRIDRAARAFVNAVPESMTFKAGQDAFNALCDALFDGRPAEKAKGD